jgi:nucleotide-binding universal stress UspA family protein
MFIKILVALDGSPYSQRALPTAIEVAKKFGSEIFVLHVSEHDKGRAAAYATETPTEAATLVANAVDTAIKAGVKASGEVRDAGAQHAARFIVEAAAEKGADLIVMGSRGLSDVQGIFLGSVTHKVIQTAEVPVLIDRSRTVKEPAMESAPAKLVGV